jgi:hypothetical protein
MLTNKELGTTQAPTDRKINEEIEVSHDNVDF